MTRVNLLVRVLVGVVVAEESRPGLMRVKIEEMGTLYADEVQ